MAGLALNLNSGDRTYGYAVSSVIMNGDASGFPFVDSGGNRIKCNYARVEVHYDYGLTDIRDHCVAWIEPSGPSSHTAHSITVDVNIANEVTTDDIAAGNVSGVYGQVTFADISNPGIVEFKCDNTEIMEESIAIPHHLLTLLTLHLLLQAYRLHSPTRKNLPNLLFLLCIQRSLQ